MVPELAWWPPVDAAWAGTAWVAPFVVPAGAASQQQRISVVCAHPEEVHHDAVCVASLLPCCSMKE